MRTGNNWKSAAVVRFILSIVVCVSAGSAIVAATSFSASSSPTSWAVFYGVAVLAVGSLGGTLWLINADWPLERTMARLALTLSLFYVGLFAGAWMHKVTGSRNFSAVQMVVSALSFQGAILALTPGFLKQHSLSWVEGFGFSNNLRPAVIAGLIVAVVFLPIGASLQQVSALAIEHFQRFGVSPEEQQSIRTLRVTTSWGARVTLGFVTILLAPVTEEILFRGVLYTWVKQAGWPRLALWGTSLIFAAVHFNALTLVPLLLLSVMLTLIYERTANLAASMAAHGCFNGLNFALLYLLSG